MSFATWLQQQMHVRNLSAAELAERAGVSEQTVNRWRSGRTVPLRLFHPDLAKALNLSMDEIAAAIGTETGAAEPTLPQPAPSTTVPRATGDEFSVWLDAEMARRGLTKRELAQKVGLTYAAVYRWFSRQRSAPSETTCRQLARVLDLPEAEVLAKAGWENP
ncbi:MAG: helix-turn-helix domain-containing protein [Chloroflexi bacterium]|nr:helix-turn-helix domain-containing protein [Chloroflexota bacterium]